MSRVDVGELMQAVADHIKDEGVVARSFGWPQEQVSPPCAVVGYPESIEFDMAFRDGSDKVTLPVWIVCGKAVERTTRDVLSGFITGAVSIKSKLDGDIGGAVQTCRVTDCLPAPVVIGGVDYMAAKFDLEIYT